MICWWHWHNIMTKLQENSEFVYVTHIANSITVEFEHYNPGKNCSIDAWDVEGRVSDTMERILHARTLCNPMYLSTAQIARRTTTQTKILIIQKRLFQSLLVHIYVRTLKTSRPHMPTPSWAESTVSTLERRRPYKWMLSVEAELHASATKRRIASSQSTLCKSRCSCGVLRRR